MSMRTKSEAIPMTDPDISYQFHFDSGSQG